MAQVAEGTGGGGVIGRRLDAIDLDTIVYGYLRGTPASEMAEVIGCHQSTIHKHYRELRDALGDGERGKRAKHEQWPGAVRRDCIRRYLGGESAMSIAREYGMDRTNVYYWVKKERERNA